MLFFFALKVLGMAAEPPAKALLFNVAPSPPLVIVSGAVTSATGTSKGRMMISPGIA